jgi:hypothetical protein
MLNALSKHFILYDVRLQICGRSTGEPKQHSKKHKTSQPKTIMIASLTETNGAESTRSADQTMLFAEVGHTRYKSIELTRGTAVVNRLFNSADNKKFTINLSCVLSSRILKEGTPYIYGNIQFHPFHVLQLSLSQQPFWQSNNVPSQSAYHSSSQGPLEAALKDALEAASSSSSMSNAQKSRVVRHDWISPGDGETRSELIIRDEIHQFVRIILYSDS